MSISVKVDAEKLMQALEAAPDVIRKEMRLAMKKAVRNIAERARREHRFISRSGKLEATIGHGMTKDTGDSVEGFVSAGGDKVPYARAIHEGSGLYGPKGARYPIVPRFRKALRWVSDQGTWSKFEFARKVMHPGVRPDPFIENASAAENAATEALFAKAIDKAMK